MTRFASSVTISLAVLTLAGAPLAGCALAPHEGQVAAKDKIRPVPMPAPAADARADDGFYADAVSAINQRDYASALDALQAARHRDAADPRVWNAMGVVYDKLGRFDLSSGYYAKAATLDPGSPIVANNRAYSQLIQKRSAPGGDAAPVMVEAQPQPSLRASRPALASVGAQDLPVVGAAQPSQAAIRLAEARTAASRPVVQARSAPAPQARLAQASLAHTRPAQANLAQNRETKPPPIAAHHPGLFALLAQWLGRPAGGGPRRTAAPGSTYVNLAFAGDARVDLAGAPAASHPSARTAARSAHPASVRLASVQPVSPMKVAAP